jgi:methylenetetrahydrofolate--tRNA-(uracil-5-)-methyltransferase
MGSLLYYITHADPENFQPMKANMGILPDLEERVRGKQQRYGVYAERASAALADYLAANAFIPVIQTEVAMA